MKIFLKWSFFVMMPRWLIVAFRSDIPRRPSDDPAEHTDYEIGWGLQDAWPVVVQEHIAACADTMSAKDATTLRRIDIDVVFAERGKRDEAVAFVRPSVAPRRLPDAAFGLLLGVPEESARAVDQALRDDNPGLISRMHVLVRCRYREGRWRPVPVDGSESPR